MSGKRSLPVFVLCEDRAHEQFVRGLFPRHRGSDFTISEYPRDGGGSGAAYVDLMIGKEIRAHAARSTKRTVCLVVVTDADNHAVATRWKQIAAKAGVAISELRAIRFLAVMIPKYEIETWVLALNDITDQSQRSPRWSESESLKRAAKGLSPRDAGKTFLDLVRHQIDRNRIPATNPSLTEGVIEFARFDASLRSHHA